MILATWARHPFFAWWQRSSRFRRAGSHGARTTTEVARPERASHPEEAAPRREGTPASLPEEAPVLARVATPGCRARSASSFDASLAARSRSPFLARSSRPTNVCFRSIRTLPMATYSVAVKRDVRRIAVRRIAGLGRRVHASRCPTRRMSANSWTSARPTLTARSPSSAVVAALAWSRCRRAARAPRRASCPKTPPSRPNRARPCASPVLEQAYARGVATNTR